MNFNLVSVFQPCIALGKLGRHPLVHSLGRMGLSNYLIGKKMGRSMPVSGSGEEGLGGSR